MFHTPTYYHMFSKKQRAILQEILEKEANSALVRILFEQAAPGAPPPDPNAAPPTDPSATPGAPPPDPTASQSSDDKSKDEGDDVKKQVDDLSKQSDEDIRKTFLAKLQNGAEKRDIDKILAYIEQNKSATEPEKKIPDNILSVVDELRKDFGIVIPPPEAKQPPKVTAESRLQKLSREYLHYKKLYLRS